MEKNIFVAVVPIKEDKRTIPEIYEVHYKGLEDFSKVLEKYQQRGWAMKDSARPVVDWLRDPSNLYPRKIEGNPTMMEVKFIIIDEHRNIQSLESTARNKE